MRTGSIVNLLMDQSSQPVPLVGMGATELGWTDRHAYTVVEVQTPKRIVVQADNTKRTDKNGMSEMQVYEYTPNPNAAKEVLTLRKNGRWIRQGESSKSTSFALGFRKAYHDFSF